MFVCLFIDSFLETKSSFGSTISRVLSAAHKSVISIVNDVNNKAEQHLWRKNWYYIVLTIIGILHRHSWAVITNCIITVSASIVASLQPSAGICQAPVSELETPVPVHLPKWQYLKPVLVQIFRLRNMERFTLWESWKDWFLTRWLRVITPVDTYVIWPMLA